ncbi:hypothetical protein CQW23_08742 [Capsicum baccatum]|uniref:Uncharacterized protein n=1 Tax=Capsicum baccatum TaxID=33114 RepID=A0A2G2X9X7_CAPBA|nr:hypothetical protein CQW23_08742 [Capsicum baccatum]
MLSTYVVHVDTKTRHLITQPMMNARLTDQESKKLNGFPEIIGISKDHFRIKLDTTRSPDFLGLNTDYGQWPES